MSRLLPLILVALALVEGVATGPLLYWKKADALISQLAVRRKQLQTEQSARAKGWDFWTIAIDNLTAELKGEKARIRQQADQLDQRTARLAAEKQELEKMRSDIEGMRRQMDERVIAIGVDEAKNLRTLAQTYAVLSPHAAVTILREMDDTTVVKILSLMKADIVGPIFEEMAKPNGGDDALAKRAAALSEKIRLMKAGPPSTATASN
jgi:flagellar motility protein MotE (MotC chaperone)